MSAMPVAMITSPTKYAVMVKAFLQVVKTRIYSKRMAHFDNAMEAPSTIIQAMKLWCWSAVILGNVRSDGIYLANEGTL